MSEREVVDLEPAFVLHQRPYRDTSQLLECLTANHGRVGLIARGSRRTRGGNRAVLQPFTPLHLSWVRRGELGQLRHVEATAPGFTLPTDRLLAAFYFNELMLRLMERGDANALVFSCYSHVLADLAEGAGLARTVRLFELRLLRALGYELALDRDVVSGDPLEPDAWYVVELELGPRKVARAGGDNVYLGRHLESLYREALDEADSVASARRLLGQAIDRYLAGRVVKSRRVLKDILERGLE